MMKRHLQFFVCVLVSLLAVATGYAVPQAEQRATEVSREWLKLVDDGLYQDAWEHCAPIFRDNISSGEWVELMQKARAPLGKVQQRVLKRLFLTHELPDAPPANYVVLEFETRFEGRAEPMAEILTPVLVGADGRLLAPVDDTAADATALAGSNWMVTGYYVRQLEPSEIFHTRPAPEVAPPPASAQPVPGAEAVAN